MCMFHIDEGLTRGDHVDQVCIKVTSGMYIPRNLAKLSSLTILKMLDSFGLVFPRLLYGIRLWGAR